jgi:hypothetical protein
VEGGVADPQQVRPTQQRLDKVLFKAFAPPLAEGVGRLGADEQPNAALLMHDPVL